MAHMSPTPTWDKNTGMPLMWSRPVPVDMAACWVLYNNVSVFEIRNVFSLNTLCKLDENKM